MSSRLSRHTRLRICVMFPAFDFNQEIYTFWKNVFSMSVVVIKSYINVVVMIFPDPVQMTVCKSPVYKGLAIA